MADVTKQLPSLRAARTAISTTVAAIDVTWKVRAVLLDRCRHNYRRRVTVVQQVPDLSPAELVDPQLGYVSGLRAASRESRI